MRFVSRKIKKVLAGVLIAALISSLTILFSRLELLSSLNLALSNYLYKEKDLSSDIVVVAIDEKTNGPEEEGGLNNIRNWNSGIYAKVLEEIEKSESPVVMFDILFRSPSDGIKSEEIIDIAEEYPKTNDFAAEVLKYLGEIHPDDKNFAETLAKYEEVFLIKAAPGAGQFDGESFGYESEIEPLDIYGSSADTGFASLVTSDQSNNLSTIYSIPYQISVNGEVEKHIDFKVSEAFAGEDNFEPILENGQMNINYHKKSYGFPMVSFADVYNGLVPTETFDNKIVLIGATAFDLQDRQFTPIDQNVPMPGVEIHANAIQTILDQNYLRHQNFLEFGVMSGVLGLTSVFAFLYLPVLLGTAAFLLLNVGYGLLANLMFGRGIILDLIWPFVAILAAYISVLAYRNFTEFGEKRKLKKAFEHYVSKDLIENVISNPDALKLGGEKRILSVLFLDIENFTTLSESLEPSKVVEIINVYFDALSNVIMSEGGTVDKFEGDAIMALFGAPLSCDDHAARACSAALKIRAKVMEVNVQMGQKLNVRVGVASGEAIVGNMGSIERFDYTAMGDTVNTASRLEGINKFYSTKILVTGTTKEALSINADRPIDTAFLSTGNFSFREIDKICPKGKNEPITIYELLEKECEFLDEWNLALEDYKKGNFAAAAEKFKKILSSWPEDGPAKTMLGRINELGCAPLGWDGVWKFKEK